MKTPQQWFRILTSRQDFGALLALVFAPVGLFVCVRERLISPSTAILACMFQLYLVYCAHVYGLSVWKTIGITNGMCMSFLICLTPEVRLLSVQPITLYSQLVLIFARIAMWTLHLFASLVIPFIVVGEFSSGNGLAFRLGDDVVIHPSLIDVLLFTAVSAGWVMLTFSGLFDQTILEIRRRRLPANTDLDSD